MAEYTGTHRRPLSGRRMTVDRFRRNTYGACTGPRLQGRGRGHRSCKPRRQYRRRKSPSPDRLREAEFDPGYPHSRKRNLIVDAGSHPGIDTPSIEEYGGDGSVHRRLLGSGWPSSNRSISCVPEGEYFMAAMPLRSKVPDGSPVGGLRDSLEKYEFWHEAPKDLRRFLPAAG